jgi:hypothetical protein
MQCLAINITIYIASTIIWSLVPNLCTQFPGSLNYPTATTEKLKVYLRQQILESVLEITVNISTNCISQLFSERSFVNLLDAAVVSQKYFCLITVIKSIKCVSMFWQAGLIVFNVMP